jgi:hypothetical protein
VKEFSKDHPTSKVSETGKEFRSYRIGASDGMGGSGGEGEAFGKPLQSSSIPFAREGWHRLAVDVTPGEKEETGPDCKCAEKVEDDWSTSIVAGTKCLVYARDFFVFVSY